MGIDAFTILLAGRENDEALIEQVRQIAPGARIITRGQYKVDPSLLGEAHVVYGWLGAEQVAAAGRLKWLQTTGAGVGWAQSPQVRAHPVVITNARIHAGQISEHLFGMLLMLTRRLHEAYRNQPSHTWQGPSGGPAISLAGRRLCVLGLGVIGRACARVGAAFGMDVVGVRRHPQPDEHCREVFGTNRLDEALIGADVVMNLLPGTKQTRRIVAAGQLDLLAEGAIFLNAGRGSTVDTDALVDALRRGRLGGAGLDVVDPEPLPPDHPLWDMPNVILSPHYAGSVTDYSERTDAVFLDNLRRFVAGRELAGVIDKQAGY